MKLFHDRLKGSLMASTFLIAAPALLASGAIAQESDNQDSGVEEITVQGRYIPDEKRATSEIANVIDADAFSLAGDSDVAVALQRVPGLSLVGGKYVYVRGLVSVTPPRFSITRASQARSRSAKWCRLISSRPR